VPEGRCWIVTTGYVKLVDPSSDDSRFIRLILGRGALFGDCPFKGSAFLGFISQPRELALAHGRVDLIQLDREELETATRAQPELAAFMLESQTSRGQFLERRLHWQFKNPIRARMAAALRDLICYEGDRCKHGHTIDVRLTHQDLAELVGAARPVVSAELVRMRNEGLIEYTRSFFCVDDLAGLDRAAGM
jgi:CRP-like cAMP-binding protein